MLAILAAVTKSYFFWILYGLYGLGVLLPSLAVTWRRMQDTGRNGLWILLGLIPFVGGIILLVFMILPGTPGPERVRSRPRGHRQRSLSRQQFRPGSAARLADPGLLLPRTTSGR